MPGGQRPQRRDRALLNPHRSLTAWDNRRRSIAIERFPAWIEVERIKRTTRPFSEIDLVKRNVDVNGEGVNARDGVGCLDRTLERTAIHGTERAISKRVRQCPSLRSAGSI